MSLGKIGSFSISYSVKFISIYMFQMVSITIDSFLYFKLMTRLIRIVKTPFTVDTECSTSGYTTSLYFVILLNNGNAYLFKQKRGL